METLCNPPATQFDCPTTQLDRSQPNLTVLQPNSTVRSTKLNHCKSVFFGNKTQMLCYSARKWKMLMYYVLSFAGLSGELLNCHRTRAALWIPVRNGKVSPKCSKPIHNSKIQRYLPSQLLFFHNNRTFLWCVSHKIVEVSEVSKVSCKKRNWYPRV